MNGLEGAGKFVYEREFLLPGQLIVSKKPLIVSTILGSCISVCLWDERLRFGGINHYMIPLWTGEKNPSYNYGDLAINKLVEEMTIMGCDKMNLKAKVFGGTENQNSHACFESGIKNTQLAIHLLEAHNIPIIAKNTGGSFGRNIRFFTDSGKVLMKLIPKTEMELKFK